MGKSPSIQDLQATDDRFRTYLQGIQADMDKNAADVKSKLDLVIADHYGSSKYDDARSFVSGRHTDFMHESEFTLANMKSVVDAVGKAVFAGTAAPAGTDVNKEAVEKATESLGKEVGAMANLELFIAGKVFDVLSNVLLSFGTSTAISFTTNQVSQSLGFGFQMFSSVSASSYQSHSFFNNEYIHQYLYIYEVRFSVEQANTEATIGLVEQYEDLLTNFEERVKKFGDQVGDGSMDADTFVATTQSYETVIETYRKKLHELETSNAPTIKAIR